jgi:ankyrin repeat protein
VENLKFSVNMMSVKSVCGFFQWFFLVAVPLCCLVPPFADAGDSDIDAAFIKAAFSGDVQEMKSFLAKGADVNAKRVDGITALIGASLAGHEEVVALLLAKGAEVDARANYFGYPAGVTAYELAAKKGHRGIVKLLVRAGASHEGSVEELYKPKVVAAPAGPDDTPRSKRD